jgi:hypothetical protein
LSRGAERTANQFQSTALLNGGTVDVADKRIIASADNSDTQSFTHDLLHLS